MAEGTTRKPEISLGDDFGDVLVKVNGATIDVSAAGYVVATSPSGVEWRAANDTAVKPSTGFHEVGDEMEDGTIYAGISPDTQKPLYATPQDAPGTYTFNEAAKYASNLDAHGHHDWRVATKGELNVLCENRNKGKLKGTFNETGSTPAHWYWSSSPYTSNYLCAQRFSDGDQLNLHRLNSLSLRCVR
jgi:hypothetical protein